MPLTNCFLHDFFLVADERAGRVAGTPSSAGDRVVEARAYEGPDAPDHGQLHRADLHHLGAERGHLQHLLVGDFGQPARLLLDARVGGVDAVDIGIDVAAVAPIAAAIATALVSEPPRPSVVMRPSGASPESRR